MNKDLKKHLDYLLPTITVTFALIGLYLLVYYILPYFKDKGLIILSALSPFILAVIFAVLIDPIVNFLENKIRLPRSIAVILTLLIVLSIIILILIIVSSRLIIEFIDISKNLPKINSILIDEGWNQVKRIRAYITSNPLPLEVQNTIQDNLTSVIETIKQIITSGTEGLLSFLATLPLIFTIIIVSAVATFFISKDKEKIANYLVKVTPNTIILPLNKILGTISSALTGFIRAQFILITITAVLATIGLYILGLDYALTIGVLTGIVDLLPILGPGSVFVPWVIINLILGNYRFAIALLILYGILITVRQLIEPKIVAESIGLHPLATLMAIFIGLRILGLAGIFIGPLILLIIKTIINVKH